MFGQSMTSLLGFTVIPSKVCYIIICVGSYCRLVGQLNGSAQDCSNLLNFIDNLVGQWHSSAQNCGNSSANALELPQLCAKPCVVDIIVWQSLHGADVMEARSDLLWVSLLFVSSIVNIYCNSHPIWSGQCLLHISQLSFRETTSLKIYLLKPKHHSHTVFLWSICGPSDH